MQIFLLMKQKLFVLAALVLVVGFAACEVSEQQAPPQDDLGADQGIPDTGDSGAQQSFQCPDGTVVEDPALCPPPE